MHLKNEAHDFWEELNSKSESQQNSVESSYFYFLLTLQQSTTNKLARSLFIKSNKVHINQLVYKPIYLWLKQFYLLSLNTYQYIFLLLQTIS